jgi:hypothetical protein
MKKIILAGLFICAALAPSQVSATLLYGWDFAGLSATSPTSSTPAVVSSTVGSGTLDISAFGLGSPQGTNPERTVFAGTTLNVFPGSVDGNPGTALALANQTANGKSMIFSFSLTGYQSLVVSFDTRGTATGFDTGTWAWSTDNVIYTTLAGVNTATRSTTFATTNVNFSAELGLNNAPIAYLRYTLSGATSASGNNRLDNIQFNATAVPEPSPVALSVIGGMAFLFGVLRRKR